MAQEPNEVQRSTPERDGALLTTRVGANRAARIQRAPTTTEARPSSSESVEWRVAPPHRAVVRFPSVFTTPPRRFFA